VADRICQDRPTIILYNGGSINILFSRRSYVLAIPNYEIYPALVTSVTMGNFMASLSKDVSIRGFHSFGKLGRSPNRGLRCSLTLVSLVGVRFICRKFSGNSGSKGSIFFSPLHYNPFGAQFCGVPFPREINRGGDYLKISGQ